MAEDDFKDKLETKLYTIVDEATIAADLRVIEKQYVDKGYYLAHASYRCAQQGENDVELIYVVDESRIMHVGSVDINGNKYFSQTEIIAQLFLKPFSRMSTFSTPNSIFPDDF